MDRKSKIWQIVLLVLLIAAIIAIVLFNNKLTASKNTLSSTIEQLNAEQKNAAALQTDLDTAKADYDEISAEFETAKTEAAEKISALKICRAAASFPATMAAAEAMRSAAP